MAFVGSNFTLSGVSDISSTYARFGYYPGDISTLSCCSNDLQLRVLRPLDRFVLGSRSQFLFVYLVVAQVRSH